MFKLVNHNGIIIKYHKINGDRYVLLDNLFTNHYEIVFPTNLSIEIKNCRNYRVTAESAYYAVKMSFKNFFSAVIKINNYYFRPFNDVHKILYKQKNYCFYPLKIRGLNAIISDGILYYDNVEVYNFNGEIPVPLTSKNLQESLIKHLGI